MKTLSDAYPIKCNCEADYYLDTTLELAYFIHRTVILSMPGYVEKASEQFQHTIGKQVHSLFPYTQPVFDKKIQLISINKSDPMNKLQQQMSEQVCSIFLNYARAVDGTMMHALIDLATKSKCGTQQIVKALTCYLNL